MLPYQNLRIVHLYERPEVLPVLEQWFIAQWSPWYGPEGAGDAHSDLFACRNRHELPICLIALNGEDNLVGTATLKEQSAGSEHGFGPWLAAVLVGKDHEGKGVGSILVKTIEEQATDLGFETIYSSTETAKGIMTRRAWQPIGTTQTLRGTATIFQKHLSNNVTTEA